MIVLKAKFKGVELKTEFDFDNKHTKLANDVLNHLKQKTVDVPDAKRKWNPPWLKTYKPGNSLNNAIYNRLRTWQSPEDGEKLIKNWGTISIPILDWIPLVCKKVSFDTTLGIYFCSRNPIVNAFEQKDKREDAQQLAIELQSKKRLQTDLVINYDKPSPAFYAGEITIARECKKSADAFRFVLAHELQHAINKLEMVYPAITDWEGFCSNVLNIEEFSMDDYANHNLSDVALDKNTEKIHIRHLELYYGKSIHTWFKGYKEKTAKT